MMTAEPQSSAIAARLAEDRATLSQALADLRGALRPAALAQRAGKAIRGMALDHAPRPTPQAGDAPAPDLPGTQAIRDHPLLSGAALVAAGALLARALPQGQAEAAFVRDTGRLAGDRLRDFLMDEALTLAETALAAAMTGATAAAMAEAAEGDTA